MNGADPVRRAPLGHGLYLRLLDALPEEAQERLRNAMTTRRMVLLRIRLVRQRQVRKLKRSLRRLRRALLRRARRSARRRRRWRRADALLRSATGTAAPVQVLAPGELPDLQFAASPRTRRERALRLIFPPAVEFPGSGPTTLVDARQLTAEQTMAYLDLFDGRSVFLVSDPDIMALRERSRPYEFGPITDGISAESRLDHLSGVYGIDRIFVLAASDHVGTPGDGATPSSPGRSPVGSPLPT